MDAASPVAHFLRPWGAGFIRLIVAIAVMIPTLAATSTGEEWLYYENSTFGYSVDVPPGFAVVTEGTVEPYRREYRSADGRQSLILDSQNVPEGEDFEAAVAERMELHRRAGRRLSDKTVTPTWASWSVHHDAGGAAYVRMISLCGGRQYAALGLAYSKRDLRTVDPMVAGLEASFKELDRRTDC